MKTVFLKILTAATLVLAAAAGAQTWDCGAMPGTVTATWSDGTLTVSGEGAMKEYTPPWANAKNAITSVVIGEGVTSIGMSAFNECKNLTSVTIGGDVASIGQMAFYKCSTLTSITIPNSVTTIGDMAFSYCVALESVEIPNSVTTIGQLAFNRCAALTSVDIPNSVISVGIMAFSGCGLTSVTIPNSITAIPTGTFSGCANLTSVTIPNSVTIIDGMAFSSCSSLTTVTIPNSVTSIGAMAFSNCSKLASVTIGSGVISIEMGAFAFCVSLTSVTSLRAIPPNVDVSALKTFYDVDLEAASLYVPEGSIGIYQFADGWQEFATIGAAVSVLSGNRVIPNGNTQGTTVAAPVNRLTAEFTAGPNPAAKSSGGIAFFWQGQPLPNGTLTVYNASGNALRKLDIKDNAAIGHNAKRAVGSWDLRDSKSRKVPEGTYLVKGTLNGPGGERVSVVVGVR